MGFATTTSQDNVRSIFQALGAAFDPGVFDFIGNVTMVRAGKPDPQICEIAMANLQVDARNCIAIEDTAICARAAHAAKIRYIAFPNAYADRSEFEGERQIVDALSVDLMQLQD